MAFNYYPQQNYGGYQQQPQYYQQPQFLQQSMINGKIVDSEESAKIQDVPIGSYGVFPKGDLSGIYIKTWNNDGTTKMISYVPVIEDAVKSNTTDDILKAIESLSKKVDSLRPSTTSRTKKKEEETDE